MADTGTVHYSYHVGSLRVTVLNEGYVTVPLPETFILNTPIETVRAALAEAGKPTDTLTTTFAPVLIETGGRLILVDTGLGPDAAAAGSTAGRLADSLSAFGITSADITDVLVTHFHADHVNGLIAAGEPVFPQARILVPEVELTFWMDDAQRAKAAPGRMQDLFANNRRILGALPAQVETYAWGDEVFAGVTAVGTPGHSIGHTSLTLSSGGKTVFLQADLTNQAALFLPNPTWAASFDQDPAQAVAVRIETYRRLSDDKTPVQAYHHPFPGLSRIERAGEGFRLVPVDGP